MSGTVEENTRWISLWITNDYDFYFQARDVAEKAREIEDYNLLRMFISFVFANHYANETVQAISREMTYKDMSIVDWAEVADDLIGE